MEPELFYWGLAGLGGLIASVAGVTISVWKWDARRIRAEANADIRRADERAKERQHELELAKLAVQKEAREREVDLLGRLERQQAEIADLRQMIGERLFTALDDARQAKASLTEAVNRHIRAVDEANKAEMAAIEKLRGDVGGLREQLAGEYEAILRQMGELLEKSSALHKTMGDLVGRLANYHERVEIVLKRNEQSQAGADGRDRQAHAEQEKEQ